MCNCRCSCNSKSNKSNSITELEALMMTGFSAIAGVIKEVVNQLSALAFRDNQEEELDPELAHNEPLFVPEIIKKLDICESTFYKHVYNQLLSPINTIGRRNYYCRYDLRALFSRYTSTKKKIPFRNLRPEG